MLALTFGDDTTASTDLSPTQQLAADQFVPLAQQLQAAEANVWDSYNGIQAMASAAGDPSLATIPPEIIAAYNATQQQLVVTATVYINAQSQADGTTYTPNPPPLLVVSGAGLGGFGMTHVAPRQISVVYGPVGSQMSVPLVSREAQTLSYMHAARPAGGGLGVFPILAIAILLTITITIVALAILGSNIYAAEVKIHVASVQLAAQQALQLKTVSTTASTMQQQCIAGGGNAADCTQKAGTAVKAAASSIPNLQPPPSSDSSFWSTVGIVAVSAVGAVAAWFVYKEYRDNWQYRTPRTARYLPRQDPYEDDYGDRYSRRLSRRSTRLVPELDYERNVERPY